MPDTKPTRFPLVVDPQNRLAATGRDARLVNGFLERKRNGQIWVYKRPGLTLYQNVSNPIPPWPTTVMTIVKDDITEIYSCLFNVHEVEVSAGVFEVWFTYDNQGTNGDGIVYPISIARFERDTGTYIGKIDTNVGGWYQFGGSGSVDTGNYIYIFGYYNVAKVLKTSPFTVTNYPHPNFATIGGYLGPMIVPDPASTTVWIQDTWQLNKLFAFDTATNTFNTTPKTVGLVDYLPWTGGVIDPIYGITWLIKNVWQYAPQRVTSYMLIVEDGEADVEQLLGASPNSAALAFQKMLYVDGHLYLLSDDTLLKYDIATRSVVTTWSVTGPEDQNGMMLHDPDRNMIWWTTKTGGLRFIGWDLATFTATVDVPFTEGAHENIGYGMGLDSNGVIWFQTDIVDTVTYSVNVFDPDLV